MIAPSQQPSRQALIAALGILIAVSALVRLNGVMTEAIFASLIALAILRTSFRTKLAKIEIFCFHLVLLICTLGTVLQTLDGIDISVRQITRTSIWSVLYMFLLTVCSKIFNDIPSERLFFVQDTIKYLVLMIAVLVLVDLTTGTELSPAVIRVKDPAMAGQRIYITASSAIAPLFFLYLWQREYLALLACAVIITASQGKTMLMAIPIALIVFAMRTPRAGIAAIALILPASLALAPTDRMSEFIEAGDLQRLRQINEALEIYTKDASTIILGAGHGTPYSEGYAQFGGSSTEQANLYENSKYDIENGVIYLLLRFGAFGIFLFFYLTLSAIKQVDARRAFVLNTIFICAASSFFATPGGIFFICGFAWVAETLVRSPPKNTKTAT